MRKKRKMLPYLFASFVIFIVLSLLIIFWSPEQSFLILDISISVKWFFFLLVFASLSCLSTFIFSNIIRGLLVGFFVASVLLLRIFGFTNIFYPVLLIVLFILIDRIISMRG